MIGFLGEPAIEHHDSIHVSFKQLSLLLLITCSLHPATSESCTPSDCIMSQWAEWTECSQSCGTDGVKVRSRQLLAAERCGGSCSGNTVESQSCNVRCCAENCEYTQWSSWGSCRCASNTCIDPGPWSVCYRYRDKVKNATCGGYCDNIIFETQCNKPCCYKDCIMGSWGPWEACDARCESDGFRVRNRIVIQESDCGGNKCEYESEKTTCKGPCCPQDCTIGPWSDWSTCPAVCGVANITRTRYVKMPVCGGANCTETEDTQTQLCEMYINIDCVMTAWSEWTDCKLNSSSCGQGTKNRQRSVMTNNQCNGQACPAAEETALCYGPRCNTDCQVGNWTDFGFCSTQCGEGKKNRTRPILIAQSGGGKPCPDVIEFTNCSVNNATNCSLTQWSQWSACSTDCGKGKNIRSRTILTPSYCGGQCSNMATEEQKDCETNAARKDCQVSAWGEWGPCIRDCERGVQRSTRNITTIEACGGVPCAGKYNLTQTRTCHEKCSQLCNQGKCSCNPGYVLNATDGYSCYRKSCGSIPKISFCGPGTKVVESCVAVYLTCDGVFSLFGDRCNSSCTTPGWIVKGDPKYTICQADGTWSAANIFCGPKNKAPLNISINSTDVSELLKINQCFAKLTTLTDNELWDKHTYSVVADQLNVLKAANDTLCLKQVVDYETSTLKKWNATIRSTDLDGLYVDVNFTFTLLDGNDPPKSAKLVPNTLAENSLKGTEIGCFQLLDDDFNQTLTIYLLTNTNLFELFKKNNQFCLRVLIESNKSCSIYGGKSCAFNYEVKSQINTAVGVKDDGVPPAFAYFDIGLTITDVNEPITDVKVSPDSATENTPPGKPLLQLVAVDDDKGGSHKFEMLNDPYGIFVITNETLSANVSLDYEANPNIKYVIKVRGTDLTPPITSVDVNITFGVRDMNEPPYMLQLTSANSLMTYPPNKPIVKENVPAVVIGMISALDPDKGDNITFSVNSDKFRIVGAKCSVMSGNNTNYCTGKLVNLAGLNYEDTPFVVLKITAQDAFKLVSQLDNNITVINMDDPPTDILINSTISDSIFVPENSKNSTVAVLQSSDEDIDDTYVYSLSGPMANQFRIDGSILSTTLSATLDYETYTVTQLNITALSTARNGLYLIKAFNIIVTNVNEAPTQLIFSKTTVPENSPEKTLVSELLVIDPDNVGTNQVQKQLFIFELLDDAKGRFYVVNGNLYVKASTQFCGQTTCQLDFETQSYLNIVVRVTDDGTPSLNSNFSQTITVTDVNDLPYNLQISTSRIRENKPAGSIIGTLSASDQDKDTILTYLLLNYTQLFSIDSHNNLAQLQSLDYESHNVYFINVQVTDNGIPANTIVSAVMVEVQNINEAPLFVGPSSLSIEENVAIGTEIGFITALDPDNGDVLEITLNNFKDMFIVGIKNFTDKEGGGTLLTVQLVTGVLLDYEAQAEYSVSLSLTDKQGMETIIYSFKIIVLDENDPIQDILLNNLPTTKFSVPENAQTSLAFLTAVDQDMNQKYFFKIVSQPQDNFLIVGNELKISRGLDYEASSSMEITLEVTDNGAPPSKKQKTVSISVLDINEPPSDLKLSNNKVEENSVDGTLIGTLQASDPDSKDSFTFSLLDSANGKFRIVKDTLLTVSPPECKTISSKFCSLNYEQQILYIVKVIVTDNGSPKESATFTLTVEVTDVNDGPYNIVLSDSKVDMSAKSGVVIGTLQASDEDKLQIETFSLKDDCGGMFSLSENKLIKATDAALDISKINSVVVVVKDSGTPAKTAEQTFYINIIGVNEAPQNLTLTANSKSKQVDQQTISIMESIPVNTSIAVITAGDVNSDQTMSFSLLVDENGQFTLDKNASHTLVNGIVMCSTNLILVKGVNFEKQEKYNIIFVARDSGNQQTSKSVTVQVSDVGESPTDITFSAPAITVLENSGNVALGTFFAVDEDRSDSHTFTLKNNVDNPFLISASGELSVVAGYKIDYESKSSYEITVVVTDSTKNMFEKIFQVDIVDVNEPPLSVKLSSNTILENSTAFIVIGDLITDDPDNKNKSSSQLQKFDYLLLDDAAGRFQLNQSTLTLTSKGAQCSANWCGLDFETQKTYQLQVQVVDSGTPKLTATLSFPVQILDANDLPVFSGATLQLKENMLVGQVATVFSATDPDVGQNITYTIDPTIGIFKIDGNNLVLAAPIDFEANPKIVLDILATDSGSPPLSAKATFICEIMNVGEPPSSLNLVSLNSAGSPVFSTDQPVLGENTKTGSLVGQFVILDPDFDEDIIIVMTSDILRVEKSSCLTVTKQGSRCVASITLNKVLDFESQSNYSIVVSVIDKYGLRLDKKYNLQIKDENDPPVSILLNNSVMSNIKVKENSQGSMVAYLSASDPDKGQTFVFTVYATSLFYISENMLKVSTAANIDYEKTKLISLTLKVTDTGQPPLSFEKNFTVEVTDVNEAPTSLTLTRNKVSEDAIAGVEVGSFVTTDPDNVAEQHQVFGYEILVNPSNLFGIRGSSLVVAVAQLDYEMSQSYILKVKVTDNGTPPLSAQFDLEVQVINVNEAPYNLQLSAFIISEMAAVDSQVGILSAQDPDVGQTISFTAAKADSFLVRDNILVVNGGLDFEMSPRVVVEITATDSGTPAKSVAVNFTITITDANEVPVLMNFNSLSVNFSVAEKTEVNTVIGYIETYDPDNIDRISMELTDFSSKNFALDTAEATCSLKLVASLKSTFTVCSQKVLLSQTVRYLADSPPFNLEARAKDKGQLMIKNSWKIIVLDSNDPPYNISIGATTLEIPENQKSYKIGPLSCDDPDIGQGHIFQVVTYWEVFSVDPLSVLVVSKVLDYEQQAAYQLTLRCIDTGVPAANFTKTFAITVLDVNEQPNDIKLSNSDISATAKADETLSRILVSDPDNTGTNTKKQNHTCVVSKDESGNFKVGSDGLSLQISSRVPINKTSVKISLNCTDSGVPPLYFVKDFDVFISNVAQVPKAILLTGNKTVYENTINVEVGQLSIINTLTETEIPGSYFFDSNNVNFTTESVHLILTSSMDFETTPTLSVQVSATGTDTNGNPIDLSNTFKIQVLDVNEPPKQINIYGGGLVIENSTPGTVIGDLNTLDPEPYQTYTYTLISVAIGLDLNQSQPELLNIFKITGRTLSVGVNSNDLDYEKAPVFSLVIQTMDSGTPSLSLNDTVRIILTDANDPPTDIALNNSQISEDANLGALVGVFVVADQDVNQTHSCIINNLDSIPFNVEGRLNLIVARAELDYETQRSYYVQVICQDNANDGSHLKVTKSIAINVTNVNEPPYDIKLSTSSINENNIIGQLVAEISATDPDSQQIFLSLTNGSSNFEIHGTGSLVASAVFDYETMSKYAITVKATDEDGLSSTRSFTVEVIDVNEKPTSIQLTQNVVSESAFRGTIVGSIVTQDPDRRQTFLYSLTETPPSDGHFFIAGDQLLVGATKLDYEFSSSYRISITSMDSGSPTQSLTVDFDIKVTDTNESPTDILLLTNPIVVMENATISTVLSDVQILDQDFNQTHSCQMVNSGVPFVFTTSTTGTIQMVVGNFLDFETQPLYPLNVSCSDGEFTIFKMVTITVKDVNEPPTAIFLRGPHFLPATSITPYPIERLEAEDNDVGQGHMFSTTGTNSDLLQVQGGNQLILVSPIPADLLDRPNPSISVTVHVADSGQPVLTFEQIITLIITDVKIEELRLTEITVNNTVISENAVAGDEISAIYDQNETIASSVVFSIIKDASSLFAIRNNKYLVLSKNISSFYGNSAEVTLQAKNSQTQQIKTRTITIVISRSDKCYDNGRTCSENARCVQLTDAQYQCRCSDDFEGDGYYCQQIDNCKVNVTRTCAQGKCKDGINAFQCYCDTGYSGVYCEVPPVDPCQGHQCNNSAACKPTDNKKSYTCVCPPGWTGSYCETNIDDCSNALCPSYQKCVDGVSSFFCICPTDKIGQRCQFYKDACMANTCDNNEICVPKIETKDHICSLTDNNVHLKINCSTLNSTDLCKTQFLEFVQQNGRFPLKATATVSSSRKKRASITVELIDSISQFISETFGSTERVERQTPENGNSVFVYLTDFIQIGDNIYIATFVVMDFNYTPFDKKTIIESLIKTCISITQSGQSEKICCSSIMEALNTNNVTSASTSTTVATNTVTSTVVNQRNGVSHITGNHFVLLNFLILFMLLFLE